MMLPLIDRILFWLRQDRLGPDIPTSHWRLFFKASMVDLCKKKFKHFADSAEFRPGAYAVSCSKISIGERVVIRPNTMLFADESACIVIEDHVMIGPGVHIYVNNHKFDDPLIPLIDQGYYASESVHLHTGCWIGANSILLPGVEIGRNAVVGAGSVVTKSVPACTVAVGNPARPIKIFASEAAGGSRA